MSDPRPPGLRKLENELAAARRFGARATKQLHAAMLADVRAAEERAEDAVRRARRAEQRARRAEDELARLRSSTTWRAGRVLVAVPARLARRGRG